MAQSNELLPCPFCGGNTASIRLWSHEGGSKEYTLQCDGCCVNVGSVGFTAANGDTRKAAVLLYETWNTRADLTPPQSPNRAVLDALKAVKSQAELLYGEDAKFNLFYIYAEMGLAATQADGVKVIDGLEEAIQWADGGMQAGHFKTLVDASKEHLKRQKGR